LPTETEEEWRKRKELQTLRRLEAKRRRSEKQRVSKSEKDSFAVTTGGCLEEIDGGGVTMGLNRSTVGAPIGLPNWAMATKQVVGIGFQGLFAQPTSQGSVDSQGGSSSSLSEMDSKSFL
ncbi:ninja-family protein AFP1-like, partial [Trifolium medium]|nr:ninja-family protein AFP1-like [Trifolium medium]